MTDFTLTIADPPLRIRWLRARGTLAHAFQLLDGTPTRTPVCHATIKRGAWRRSKLARCKSCERRLT
jgi:hypothetical protein